MKRALLIAGGTVGGLGAVLSITPPQFGSSSTVAGGISTSTKTSSTSSSTTASTTTSTQTTAAQTTSTPAATSTKKATATATKKATATATKAASAAVSGTFTGSVSQTRYGNVQVEITVSNGKITAAKALQQPDRDFRSQSISQQAIPYLIQETIAANSSNIQGVGGASYTSQGWYDSLVSALAKAGMK